ncbi:hypothetical protein PR048_025942 [Dryococelus australis]|uniref:Uncharacterized protein n=1 Tax=Dryococelus australis TaxID=614101 RepID=A0ABQ9GJX6_9NEOP|nr:hypothetical protein PR048_025942 [Dryococelus australis]
MVLAKCVKRDKHSVWQHKNRSASRGVSSSRATEECTVKLCGVTSPGTQDWKVGKEEAKVRAGAMGRRPLLRVFRNASILQLDISKSDNQFCKQQEHLSAFHISVRICINQEFLFMNGEARRGREGVVLKCRRLCGISRSRQGRMGVVGGRTRRDAHVARPSNLFGSERSDDVGLTQRNSQISTGATSPSRSCRERWRDRSSLPRGEDNLPRYRSRTDGTVLTTPPPPQLPEAGSKIVRCVGLRRATLAVSQLSDDLSATDAVDADKRNSRISRNALDADALRRYLLHPDWLPLNALHRIASQRIALLWNQFERSHRFSPLIAAGTSFKRSPNVAGVRKENAIETINPFTVTSYFSEALLKFYFQDIPPPRANQALVNAARRERCWMQIYRPALTGDGALDTRGSAALIAPLFLDLECGILLQLVEPLMVSYIYQVIDPEFVGIEYDGAHAPRKDVISNQKYILSRASEKAEVIVNRLCVGCLTTETRVKAVHGYVPSRDMSVRSLSTSQLKLRRSVSRHVDESNNTPWQRRTANRMTFPGTSVRVGSFSLPRTFIPASVQIVLSCNNGHVTASGPVIDGAISARTQAPSCGALAVIMTCQLEARDLECKGCQEGLEFISNTTHASLLATYGFRVFSWPTDVQAVTRVTFAFVICSLSCKQNGAAPECKGGEKWEIPEKTRRPAALSDATPTRENPRSPTMFMLPEADSRRRLVTVGHTHLHVFLVRCPDDKRRRSQRIRSESPISTTARTPVLLVSVLELTILPIGRSSDFYSKIDFKSADFIANSLYSKCFGIGKERSRLDERAILVNCRPCVTGGNGRDPRPRVLVELPHHAWLCLLCSRLHIPTVSTASMTGEAGGWPRRHCAATDDGHKTGGDRVPGAQDRAGDIPAMPTNPLGRCYAIGSHLALTIQNNQWTGPRNPQAKPPSLKQITISTLASHHGEPGSVPGRLTGFSQVGIAPAMPLVGGFSRGSPVPPSPSYRRRSIFTSITSIGSQDLARPRNLVDSFAIKLDSKALRVLEIQLVGSLAVAPVQTTGKVARGWVLVFLAGLLLVGREIHPQLPLSQRARWRALCPDGLSVEVRTFHELLWRRVKTPQFFVSSSSVSFSLAYALIECSIHARRRNANGLAKPHPPSLHSGERYDYGSTIKEDNNSTIVVSFTFLPRIVLLPLLKAVHDKVTTFEINLGIKSLPLHAYILTGAPSDMRPVKLVTMEEKSALHVSESLASDIVIVDTHVGICVRGRTYAIMRNYSEVDSWGGMHALGGLACGRATTGASWAGEGLHPRPQPGAATWTSFRWQDDTPGRLCKDIRAAPASHPPPPPLHNSRSSTLQIAVLPQRSCCCYSRLTITSDFPEALLKLYSQDVSPPYSSKPALKEIVFMQKIYLQLSAHEFCASPFWCNFLEIDELSLLEAERNILEHANVTFEQGLQFLWPPTGRAQKGPTLERKYERYLMTHNNRVVVYDKGMERRWNARAGVTGESRDNPPTSGIVRQDSYVRKSPGIEPAPFALAASENALKTNGCVCVCDLLVSQHSVEQLSPEHLFSLRKALTCIAVAENRNFSRIKLLKFTTKKKRRGRVGTRQYVFDALGRLDVFYVPGTASHDPTGFYGYRWIPFQMLFPTDKLGFEHVHTGVDFTIGSQFIRHALDDSEPIADLQGNK